VTGDCHAQIRGSRGLRRPRRPDSRVSQRGWSQGAGAAGADGVTIEQFEEDLSGNLYRLWNRMVSGSYHPGPVRAVEIPKKGKQGGIRVLGIPNVVDRVAMVAAAMALEPSVEPVFHEDSYGYRPGRSPVDAVRVCRERCFRKDWVVDLDIRAFFDSVHGTSC
jgi:RNA-directed DNA polymerase